MVQTAVSRVGFHSARRSLPALDAAPPALAAGRFVRASYSNPYGNRTYKVYIPARDQGQRRPLLVMLHGCKQNADGFAAGTRMNALADEFGFIVAYPEQALAANTLRCWNWFQSDDQQRDLGESSAHPVPAIVFHGDVDTTVHPSNSEHAFAARTVESGEACGRTYTRTLEAGGTGRPALEHWLVHGAGHAWSGGSRSGSYADPLGPDASREMLRFFLRPA